MNLVIGLGNPGKIYERTRHNAGFLVIDELRKNFMGTSTHMVCQSLVSTIRFDNSEVILAKPVTFMNHSGFAVKELIYRYDLDPSCLLVIHDDVDFELGTIRIKIKGSDGGHKGVRSIIESLGTNEFARVRVGIGKPQGSAGTSEYVLSPFDGDQWEHVQGILEKSTEIVKTVLKKGVTHAMNLFNRDS